MFRRLFGSKEPEHTQPETYKDFAIIPQPQKDAGGWRISALIEKDGKSHTLIRADVLNDHETAITASVNKAKQMIDEQGDRLFG